MFVTITEGGSKPKGCPSCGSTTGLDGDNLAAWCNDCDWDNFGTY